MPHEDLPTIDMETSNAARRRSGIHRATCASYTREFTDASHANVGEEVIRTCVTPRRVRGVQLALRKENERHRCAVKLLPYFFTDEELISSNTDGSHGKLPLDSNKLNS